MNQEMVCSQCTLFFTKHKQTKIQLNVGFQQQTSQSPKVLNRKGTQVYPTTSTRLSRIQLQCMLFYVSVWSVLNLTDKNNKSSLIKSEAFPSSVLQRLLETKVGSVSIENVYTVDLIGLVTLPSTVLEII